MDNRPWYAFWLVALEKDGTGDSGIATINGKRQLMTYLARGQGDGHSITRISGETETLVHLASEFVFPELTTSISRAKSHGRCWSSLPFVYYEHEGR